MGALGRVIIGDDKDPNRNTMAVASLKASLRHTLLEEDPELV